MQVDLIPLQKTAGNKIICSLPLPPFNVAVNIPGAEAVQTIPLGHWGQRAMLDSKQTWAWPEEYLETPNILEQAPRRCLVSASFAEPVSGKVKAELIPGGKIVENESNTASAKILPDDETYHHRDEEIYHYVKREDSALLTNGENSLKLRLGMNVNGEFRYWQWCEVIPAWSGPLSNAFTIGGHIYAGEEERPMTISEARKVDELDFIKESTVGAKAFVVIYNDGLFEFSAHFANIQGYGMGSQAFGLPFIELAYEDSVPKFEVECNKKGIKSGDKSWQWTPLESTKVFLGKRLDSVFIADSGELNSHYVKKSSDGMVEGLGCSFEFSACFDNAEAPLRCLAQPEWYKKCGEFGLSLPEAEGNEFELLKEISDLAVPVFLRNKHSEEICRGGVYRYLDGDSSGRYEFSMDGNESIYIYRGAYMRTSYELYKLAFDSVKYITDVALDHYYFNIHYHGDTPDWNFFSLIYLRFGGMVNNWLETGDPYYLENAQAVASRWISVNRQNQPRKNMGRDTEPLEGIMALYDATGYEIYWEEAEKIAHDVVRSLFEDNFWRSGFGVGPFWGTNALKGQAWNGSHLFAGICEFLFRASPMTCKDYACLLRKACDMARRIIKSIDEDYDGFHRTSGAYLPRRMFLIAHIAEDEQLMNEVIRIIHGIEANYLESGNDFFKAGHHCAGYLDSPYVVRSAFNKKSKDSGDRCSGDVFCGKNQSPPQDRSQHIDLCAGALLTS